MSDCSTEAIVMPQCGEVIFCLYVLLLHLKALIIENPPAPLPLIEFTNLTMFQAWEIQAH